MEEYPLPSVVPPPDDAVLALTLMAITLLIHCNSFILIKIFFLKVGMCAESFIWIVRSLYVS